MPKRPGAGRKPMSFENRRVPFSISLPPAMVDWLDGKPDSRSYVIEQALRKQFKLEERG